MTAPLLNQQWRLAARPEELPDRRHWSWTEQAVEPLQAGEVLVEVQYVSLDPAMRGWMNAGRSYIDGVEVGDVMRAAAGGRVVESSFDGIRVGQSVVGLLGVQRYAVVDGRRLLVADLEMAPLAKRVGGLGGTGLTAYFGLLDVGQPKAGETVLVSAAAGAVGSVVGQIAKIKGCRAVGIAGGPDKCAYIVERFGFDAAIDYKSDDVMAAIKETCPDGVDIYFDNVGGAILDAALARLANGARVVICGAIAGYNDPRGFRGPKNYMNLLVKRARMEGFVLFDYRDRYAEGTAQLATWMGQGKLRLDEHIIEGIEHFPEAFLRLFSGDKRGKLLLAV